MGTEDSMNQKDEIAVSYTPNRNLQHNIKFTVIFLIIASFLWFAGELFHTALGFWGDYGEYEGSWLYHNTLTWVMITSIICGIYSGRTILNLANRLEIDITKGESTWRFIFTAIMIGIGWNFREINPIPISDGYVFLVFSSIIIGLSIDEFLDWLRK